MLSDKIKELRCKKGLSQSELANKLNVVRQTVSKWEKGLSLPDSAMLVNIAMALDTSVSALLEVEDAIEQSLPTKSKVLKTTQLILIIIGSPIWLSLVVAAAAIFFAAYAVMWSVIIALWSAEIYLIVCSLSGITSAVFFAFNGNIPIGFILFSAGLFCAGASIFLFFGCKGLTKGAFILTKNVIALIGKIKPIKRGAKQ